MVMIPGAAGQPATFGSGIAGINDGSLAAAGLLGQKSINQVIRSAPVALATGVSTNVFSFTIPQGDWLVFGHAGFSGLATTLTYARMEVSATSAAFGSSWGGYTGISLEQLSWNWNTTAAGALSLAQGDIKHALGMVHVSLSAPLPLFLVTNAIFSGGSCSAYGTVEFIRSSR